MDIAITGASGLIGTALTERLQTDGHRVIAVVRRPPQPGEDAVRWDPATGAIDSASLEGIDGVVHLAGETIGKRFTAEHKRNVLQSRLQGTGLIAKTLLDLNRPPSVLLSGSAIGFYGDRGDEELTEESSGGSDFLADVVHEWEQAATPVADSGIRVAWLRSGIILSGKGGALEKQLLLFKLGLGGRFGSGQQWQSWISIDDEVGAIAHLLTHDVAGPVNLTAPAPVRNEEFTKTLGRVLHRPTLIPVPSFGPRLILGREGADTIVFGGQRVLPAVLQHSGYHFQHPTVEEGLRAALGN